MLIDDAGEMTEINTGLVCGEDWAGFWTKAREARGKTGGATGGSGPLPRNVAVRTIVSFLTKALRP